MKFKGGIKEAAAMLNALPPEQARRILSEIKAQDPQMAEELEKNLITMDDLRYITPTMLIGLLRDIPLPTFGLALRGVTKDVSEILLKMVSSNMKLEIEEGLTGPPRRMSEVSEAQQKVLQIVRSKVEKGEMVLSRSSSDTIV